MKEKNHLIFNCTQHELSKEQLLEIEFRLNAIENNNIEREDLKSENNVLFGCLANLKYNSSFYTLSRELKNTITNLSKVWDEVHVILPIGSPAFLFYFGRNVERWKRDRGEMQNVDFWFSFSERISKEFRKEDGSVEKISTFSHKTFLRFDM